MKLSKTFLAATIALTILTGTIAPKKAEAGLAVMIAGAATHDYYASRSMYTAGFIVLMIGILTFDGFVAILDTDANQNAISAQLTARFPVLAKLNPAVTSALVAEFNTEVIENSLSHPGMTKLNVMFNKDRILNIMDQADVKTQEDRSAIDQMVETLTNAQFAS